MPRKKTEPEAASEPKPRKRAASPKAKPALKKASPADEVSFERLADELLEAPEELVESSAEVLSQALTFTIADQLYGLPIESVQEIQQLVELIPLPDAAPALVGLLDVRGLVVPAIDLRLLVGMERRPYTLETPMIFCRAHGRIVCLIVDAVEDVVEIPEGSIQPASSLYALADRMIGVCRLARGMVLMFDPEKLVPDAALAVADSMRGERA